MFRCDSCASVGGILIIFDSRSPPPRCVVTGFEFVGTFASSFPLKKLELCTVGRGALTLRDTQLDLGIDMGGENNLVK
jgi:hypothetical protein